MSTKPVVIIGAGLAGLCCAGELARNSVEAVLLESQDDVGGRVRTDVVDGFRLDRGFQVLQTGYPEACRQLDYNALCLHTFHPGALIHTGAGTVVMSDPWRRPQDLLPTLFNGVGALSDRWKLARLRWNVTRKTIQELYAEPDTTTDAYLRNTCGFSSDMVDRFFRPWFSGVFLEDKLETSSRFFKFIFRMFAVGDAALPKDGMGAITKQLADRLTSTQIRLGTRVESLDGLRVRLETGETIESRALVLAVDGPEASRLTNGRIRIPAFNATTCLYYSAEHPPFRDKLLMLNGDRTPPINNLCVPTNVVAGYAPEGQTLMSVSVVNPKAEPSADIEPPVRRQLRDWFGAQVNQWSFLRSYLVRNALPAQPAHFRDVPDSGCRLMEGLYRCGDYCETASIQGAMVSGRKAAEAISTDLHSRRKPF